MAKLAATRRRPRSAKKDKDLKGAGTGAFAANQPPLDAMKDVDECIKELTDECQRYLSEKDKQGTAKAQAEEHSEKIGELLKKHGLDFYTVNGKKFYIEPGSPSVKCVNVKQKG